MYVLGANENLIETFRLIAQSAESRPLFPAADGDETPAQQYDDEVYEARALLAEDINACCSATERHWLVLVAKEWEPHVLNAIADVARLCISQSANHSTAHIMVVKRERCAGDFELLRDHLSATRESWRAEWANAYEKYSRLGESSARVEHLAKVERWARPPQLDFQLIYMDALDLLEQIREFGGISANHDFVIADATTEMDDALNCFVKPPALHWTNYPREADVQVSFKFTFPIGTVTNALFRTWSATVRDCYGWEYIYEWTNGLFARQQLVKIALVRGPNNIVEITGRIDKDEAGEEDKEEREDVEQTRKKSGGTDGKKNVINAHWGQPLHRVWPYFAKAFECFLADIYAIEMLPYTLNLVLIGELFFDSIQDARRVNSRSLDAVQTFGAIERAKAVRFKVHDDPEHVYAVRLAQAFPGFTPTQLADICTGFIGKPPIPITTTVNTPSATVMFQLRSDSTELLADTAEDSVRNSMTNISSDSNSAVIPSKQAMPTGDGSLSSSPVNPRNGSICSALLDRGRQGSNCLLTDRQLSAQRNRGRRVSFGTIRAIPPSDISTSASTSPLLVRSSGSSLSTTAGNTESKIPEEHQPPKSAHVNAEFEKNGHVQTSDVINEYVDHMLLNAMDEVLINK